MRGFASGRARWPVDFGLVHHDTLWILDEVQLMDVGLATTSQLAALRAGHPSLRRAFSWWMSATLQPGWLATFDARGRVPALADSMLTIPAEARTGALFDVRKQLTRREDVTTPEEVAGLAAERHAGRSLTLVVANTVDRAVAIAAALEERFTVTTGSGKNKARARRADAPEVRLVHSRFRGHERARWDFLSRAACATAALPEHGRIVVATQVVEAGVDVSAATLVTDLAPWPSLVQRFGRCARYAGESGALFVVGAAAGKPLEKLAGPYEVADLEASDRTVTLLGEDGAPRAIEALEGALDDAQRAALYRYEPFHILRQTDLEELFDTSKDLSGGDVDPSRFIRSGEERDVTVLWRSVSVAGPIDDTDDDPNAPEAASAARRPRSRALELSEQPLAARDELCRVPVGQAREWLEGLARFWTLDYLDGQWQAGTRPTARRIRPGDVVLVEAAEGGYTTRLGFDAKSKAPVEPVDAPERVAAAVAAFDRAAASEGSDAQSELGYQTIATHGRAVGDEVARIATELGLDARVAALLALAGRWHDVGKAHPVFQRAIGSDAGERPERGDLAKAPPSAWRRPAYPERPGFRHELASLLALYGTVARARPDHPALVVDLAALAATHDEGPPIEPLPPDHPLAAELCALAPDELDLVAWCVLTHHGKVRCTLGSTLKDQSLRPEEQRVHGVREGDVMPAVRVATGEASCVLPDTRLDLALARLGLGARYGRSWAERVADLRAQHGPFVLTYLEALLRAADVRASMRVGDDPLLAGDAKEHA